MFLPIDSTKTEVFLGIEIDHELRFDDHVNHLCKKAGQKLNTLGCIAPLMNLSKKWIIIKFGFFCIESSNMDGP